MINKPIPFFFATVGTIFLIIAVIGNSKLAIIEIKPGGCGRFLALILGSIFYALVFYSFLPLEFWQISSDATSHQIQESIKSLVPDQSQLMTYFTKFKLDFIHLVREIKALANQGFQWL